MIRRYSVLSDASSTGEARRAPGCVFPGRYAGKVAIVTGAAQGTGRTLALRLAREGGKVALVDRSELVDEVGQDAESHGGETLTVTADLETHAGAVTSVAKACERFGRLDLAIHNVGGSIWARPSAVYDEGQFEAEIRRSLFPTLWSCRAIWPALIESGGGAIVNVSPGAQHWINGPDEASEAIGMKPLMSNGAAAVDQEEDRAQERLHPPRGRHVPI